MSAPNRPPLSPAAQAVMNAIKAVSPAPADEIAAVALRAAADQVVPDNEITPWGSTVALSKPAASIRASLLAIAAELKGRHA